ncbi:STR-94 protein, partial [Aphelenchoides avenae]
ALLYEQGYFILVADGFFHGKNAIFDFVCVAAYCGMIHANCVMVVVQFIWRYQLVCRADSGNPVFVKTWWVIIPIVWSLLQAANTFYLFAFNDPHVSGVIGRQILEKVGWHPGTTAYPGMGHLTNIHTAIHHIFYMVTLSGGYGIVVWCQYKIIKHMHRHGKSIRESTRRAHAEINRAMVALAIAPLLTSMGPTLILVTCMVIDFSPGAITVYLSLGMTMITMMNPLTTIYFVRPFRESVMGMLTGKLARVGTTRTTSSDPQRLAVTANQSSPAQHNDSSSSSVY